MNGFAHREHRIVPPSSSKRAPRRVTKMVCVALCGCLALSLAACSQQRGGVPSASTPTPSTSASVISTSASEATTSAPASSAPSVEIQRKAYAEIHSAAE